MAKWRASSATGEMFEVEARACNAAGDYRWFLVRAEPLRDRTGTIVKWYGTSIDIEDRKRAVEALRESEEHWREVFKHNPVMYFIVDATGTVLSVNSFGAAQLGYTVDKVVGQSVFNVFLPEDRELVRRNVASRLENPGEAGTWEIRGIRKDGAMIWVRENAKAVMSGRKTADDVWRADSEPIVLIACRDIAETRERRGRPAGKRDVSRRSPEDRPHGQFWLARCQRPYRVVGGDFLKYKFNSAVKPALDLVFQRIHPEDRASIRRALERAAHDGRDWEVENLGC